MFKFIHVLYLSFAMKMYTKMFYKIVRKLPSQKNVVVLMMAIINCLWKQVGSQKAHGFMVYEPLNLATIERVATWNLTVTLKLPSPTQQSSRVSHDLTRTCSSPGLHYPPILELKGVPYGPLKVIQVLPSSAFLIKASTAKSVAQFLKIK